MLKQMMKQQGFEPRPYQWPALAMIFYGIYNNVLCRWHRRSGKDMAFWNLIVAMARKVPGNYFYLQPTHVAARKIIFEGVTKGGKRFVDFIPENEICRQLCSKGEMSFAFVNSSNLYIGGQDILKEARGITGIVSSEHFLGDEKVNKTQEAVSRYNGWVAFPFSLFRGNEDKKKADRAFFQNAQEDCSWYTEVLTVEDTLAMNSKDVQKKRKRLMNEELFQEEMFCGRTLPPETA